MKVFFMVLILTSSVAFADKKESKSQVDDCFLSLMQIRDAQNEAREVNPGRLPFLDRKFDEKKPRCMSLKQAYVKQYGSYTLPQQGGN